MIAMASLTLALAAACGGSPNGSPDAKPEQRSVQASSSAASCVARFSPETLRDRAFAFDGTVELVEMREDPKLPLQEGQLPNLVWTTFKVNKWFNGGEPSGESSTIQIWVDPHAPGGVWPLEVGDRLLAAGEYRWGQPPEDPLAWGCGFTQPYTPKAAVHWSGAMFLPK